MKTPNIWPLAQLLESCSTVSTSIDGKTWVPCRPEKNVPTLAHRIRVAWMAFSGRADVVVWPQNQ